MASGLNDLTARELDQIEQARLRASRRAERRELLTETSLAAGFLVLAGLLLAVHGGGHLALAAWLTAIYTLLVRIDFEVGEGITHPLQLALVPMLLLLPPGEVPLAAAAAHVAGGLPEILRRRVPAQRVIVSIADAWYVLAPASLVAVTGVPDGTLPAALLALAAVAAMMASDLVVSSLRLRLGLGLDPREQLRGYAWVYLADACLAPVGLLAALAGRGHPAVLGAVLPLAALLAVFARERHGRIENAAQLQRIAEESSDRLQSILHNASDLVAIVDADGTTRTLMGSVESIFGPEWTDAQGGSLLDRVHPEDVATVRAFLGAVAEKPAGEQQEAEWRMRYADGTHRHVAAVATNLLGDERVGGLVLTARDVDERKAFEEQLRHRAFHDTLTGLANRALFYDRIEHALTRGVREDGRVAVLYVDLDDFKPINDTRGHAQGDRLLEEVARRLSTCLRSGDTAARLGGDEFGILLEAVDHAGAADVMAERVLQALAQPLAVGEDVVAVGASVGMVVSEPGDRGVEELLRKADLAMYEAKHQGKGRAVSYDAELERVGAADRESWFRRDDEQRAEIRAALEDPDALTMVFQPLMDLRTGRVAGYESLARFNRTPQRPPNEWFAQAHRCGLGYALEAKAIVAALAEPGRPAGTYLSINLSPSSLTTDEVIGVLPAELDGLVIEVTENELVSDDPAIERAIAALRARGARLAVDDTGAGYAGLTHVMRLAPDVIKLDRALTTGVDRDPVKAALVASFVRYARDIDATVCSEGVETLADLERLADLDVTYGQGYGIARPAPAWADAAPDAVATCLASFEASLDDRRGQPGRADHDRRLELLARRLAGAVSADDLDACLDPIADELRADEVRVVAAGGPSAAFAADVTADLAAGDELRAEGFAARLAVPIAYGGRTVGQLEALCRNDRPWSRFEIGRARILAHQLGPVLVRTHPASSA